MGLFGKKKEEKSCCCGSSCTPEAMAQAETAKKAAGVKVLGSGCAKCHALEDATKEALEELGMDSTCLLYTSQGDITTLAADAIVNAANSQMLGCFVPCHGCIDNAIHTYAGIQLRLECAKLMAAQGKEEPTGKAKITKAYNLPCRYVLHTVGPIIYGAVTKTDRGLLADCYRSCLDLAAAHRLQSVAFCCISTGEFHFPGELAAEIAIQTVKTWQQQNPNQIEVIFNVFKDSDYEIYKRLL